MPTHEEKKARNRENQERWRKKNSEKARMLQKRWRDNNREHLKEYARNKWATNKAYRARQLLKSRAWGLNITVDELQSFLREQGDKCAICGTLFSSSRDTHLDHDHLTGKLRALLCRRCNHGIGFFSDDIGLLERAIAYLRSHKKQK